jgi:hypothetical protein
MTFPSRLGSSAELAVQPGFRGAPAALRRRRRHVEQVGYFVDRQAAKRAKLDELGELGINGPQPTERIIERENWQLLWSRHVHRFIEGHVTHAVASLVRGVAAGMVDEDPAHDPGCNAKEVGAILPVDVMLIDEANVRFVYQRGGLQRVIWTFTPKLLCRHAPKLGVDQRP